MSFAHIPLGKNAPEKINVVIEIPQGSRVKYEYDEELDAICFDRLLHSAMYYPTNYGFAPETRSDDGDHLDVLVFASEPLTTGTMILVRPLGALDMIDGGEGDVKIMAVADKDPYFKHMQSLDDLNPHELKVIKHFFEVYKDLENKKVNVREWMDQKAAYRVIESGVEKYKNEGHIGISAQKLNAH